jgi:hypothetical protein
MKNETLNEGVHCTIEKETIEKAFQIFIKESST